MFAFEDVKKYENSFKNFNKANQYLSEIIKYDISHDVEKFIKIKKTINFISNNKIDKNLRQLIFIVGMPRSGTSLVEQIISSHSNVFGGGELPYLSNILHEVIFNNKNLANIDNNKFNKLLKIIQGQYVSKISIIDSSDKMFIDKAPLNFKYVE